MDIGATGEFERTPTNGNHGCASKGVTPRGVKESGWTGAGAESLSIVTPEEKGPDLPGAGSCSLMLNGSPLSLWPLPSHIQESTGGLVPSEEPSVIGEGLWQGNKSWYLHFYCNGFIEM